VVLVDSGESEWIFGLPGTDWSVAEFTEGAEMITLARDIKEANIIETSSRKDSQIGLYKVIRCVMKAHKKKDRCA